MATQVKHNGLSVSGDDASVLSIQLLLECVSLCCITKACGGRMCIVSLCVFSFVCIWCEYLWFVKSLYADIMQVLLGVIQFPWFDFSTLCYQQLQNSVSVCISRLVFKVVQSWGMTFQQLYWELFEVCQHPKSLFLSKLSIIEVLQTQRTSMPCSLCNCKYWH